MSPTCLPEWPPSLTPEQHDHLLLLASTYALSHGFTILPPNSTTPPTHTFAAPLSLFPTPFPRHLYQLAKDIQPMYNTIYARIALDWDFLDRVMGGSVSKVDSFQGELWRGWKRVRDELIQVATPLEILLCRPRLTYRSLLNWEYSGQTISCIPHPPKLPSRSSRSNSIPLPPLSVVSVSEQENYIGKHSGCEMAELTDR